MDKEKNIKNKYHAISSVHENENDATNIFNQLQEIVRSLPENIVNKYLIEVGKSKLNDKHYVVVKMKFE